MNLFTGETLMRFHIEGMDCASCVGKIETALTRMQGVSDVRLNFATETLELTLSPQAGIQAEDIRNTINSLGFVASALTGPDAWSRTAGITADRPTAGQSWWQ